MSKISVIATFEVEESLFDECYQKLCGHAALSLKEDEGCERFDVMRPKKTSGRAMIYEIWSGKEALGVHADSEHTAQYRSATGHMVKNRELTICDLNEGGGQ